jgi:prephenate dehydrogenase
MSEDGFSLQDSTVAIVGLGLMGGSLALALRKHCHALLGVDSHPATLELALANHIVDRADADPARLLPQADLIILATPVPAILSLLKQLSEWVPKSCIVFDLGSTKRLITEVMADLPERFDPVGGHPICGKEKLTLENAEEGLFRSAPFVVTTIPRSTSRAQSAVEQLILAIGGYPVRMDASEHDRMLALTSHLPFLISSALAAVLAPAQEAGHEIALLAGPGLRSTSRLAGTPSSMMLGVLETNRENVLAALDRLKNELTEFELALSTMDSDKLLILLDRSHSAYQSFAR